MAESRKNYLVEPAMLSTKGLKSTRIQTPSYIHKMIRTFMLDAKRQLTDQPMDTSAIGIVNKRYDLLNKEGKSEAMFTYFLCGLR